MTGKKTPDTAARDADPRPDAAGEFKQALSHTRTGLGLIGDSALEVAGSAIAVAWTQATLRSAQAGKAASEASTTQATTPTISRVARSKSRNWIMSPTLRRARKRPGTRPGRSRKLGQLS